MCSALRGGDVVYKAVNTLVVTVVVLKGNLHRNAVPVSLTVDDLRIKGGLSAV